MSLILITQWKPKCFISQKDPHQNFITVLAFWIWILIIIIIILVIVVHIKPICNVVLNICFLWRISLILAGLNSQEKSFILKELSQNMSCLNFLLEDSGQPMLLYWKSNKHLNKHLDFVVLYFLLFLLIMIMKFFVHHLKFNQLQDSVNK